jgi:hypothetical protein
MSINWLFNYLDVLYLLINLTKFRKVKNAVTGKNTDNQSTPGEQGKQCNVNPQVSDVYLVTLPLPGGPPIDPNPYK